MKFAGIIAEYDPFHNGHAWQLAQARALGAQRVAVAMSCGLTQRGALPLLPEAVRVRAALYLRGRLRLCPACPLRLGRGRGLCPRGGAPCRRRVRRAGLRGRDAGRRPPDARQPGLLCADYRAALKAQLSDGARKLCRRAAGCGGSALPGHGRWPPCWTSPTTTWPWNTAKPSLNKPPP